MRKRTFVAPFVLTVGCSGGNTAHVEPKPSAPLERYQPPDEAMIDAAVPDAEPTARLPTCGDPGVTCNPPRSWADAGPVDPAPAPPLYRARIIDVDMTPTGTIITLALGQRDGIERGWRGAVIDRNGRPIPGGDFIVIQLRDATCTGKVNLTPDQIGNNPNARLEPPSR